MRVVIYLMILSSETSYGYLLCREASCWSSLPSSSASRRRSMCRSSLHHENQQTARRGDREPVEEFNVGTKEDLTMRRQILVRSFAAFAGLGAMSVGSSAAVAADKSNMNSSNMAQQGPPKNRKIGGFVSKIRGVGGIMVCFRSASFKIMLLHRDFLRCLLFLGVINIWIWAYTYYTLGPSN